MVNDTISDMLTRIRNANLAIKLVCQFLKLAFMNKFVKFLNVKVSLKNFQVSETTQLN